MMTSNRDCEQTQGTAAQPSTDTGRKRRRVGHVLALIGRLVMYVAGLYSRPLLFGATQHMQAENNVVQADAPARDEPRLDLQDLSITQAYQVLAEAMSNLGHREYTTPELEARLAALEQEIAQLRTPNAYYRSKEIRAGAISATIPDVCGATLDVSSSRVRASMNAMGKLDPTCGKRKIALHGTDLERYIRVGSATACRYRCSARSLVKPDGVAACGCAHSQAMRGLGACLITNHPGDYSDEELVEDLNW